MSTLSPNVEVAERVATSPSDLIATAKALRPLLEREAEATEAAGTASGPAVDAMREAGMFALMVPQSLGGLEVDLTTFTQVMEELSYADGSLGWTALANSTNTAFAAAFLEDSAVEEMFGNGLVAAAAQLSPRGTAVRTPDGSRVQGSYAFCSGGGHAQWIGFGTMDVVDGKPALQDNGHPITRAFFVPRERVEFMGGWNVMGLVGTGSFDYRIREQVVRDEFSFAIMDSPRRGTAAHRLTVPVLGVAGHAGWALGAARRALDEALAAHDRPLLKGFQPVGELEGYLTELGQLDLEIKAARAYVIEAFQRAEAHIADREAPSPEVVNETNAAVTLATRVGVKAVRKAFEWSGVAAVRRGVMERVFRDVHVAAQHVTQTRMVFANQTRSLLDARRM